MNRNQCVHCHKKGSQSTGKTGRMMKLFQMGKNREFENSKGPSQNQENRSRKKQLCDVDGFIFEVSNDVILLQNYTGKTEITQGKLKLHRENAGSFTF